MTMLNAKNVVHGTINGGATAINVDMSRIEHSAPVRVLLTTAYAIQHPPGTVTRPQFTGAAAASLDYPRTLASGTYLTTFKAEADALVAASAATYA